MLMKIGDVTSKYNITHRSLHYWESAGIIKSSRAENDYRFYDDENLLRIKQIVLLRKLRLSIPSIQEIFSSSELSKIIGVFTQHLDTTRKETEQLDALGTILRRLINMLKDKQNMESVYGYLDANHSTESEEIKAALKKVLSEPVNEITMDALPEPVVDMAGVDLSLEPYKQEDAGIVTEAVKKCYAHSKDLGRLPEYFNFGYHLNTPGCAFCYKIMQSGECIGAVNLMSVGMEAMLIRDLAYGDADNNIYLFELFKQQHPDILCWNIYLPNDAESAEEWELDWDGKRHQFAEDNGFTFYTDARWNRHIKMLKPHDEVYNSSRYRFALLDGSMDGVAFRFFGLDRLDFYDGKMINWRVNDCDFSNALIFNSWLGNSKFYENGIENSNFCYTSFKDSTFLSGSFNNCKITDCDIQGMTIDGVNVSEALEYFKTNYVMGDKNEPC